MPHDKQSMTLNAERGRTCQRRQRLATIFSEVALDDGELVAATPRPGWLPYLERALAGQDSGSFV